MGSVHRRHRLESQMQIIRADFSHFVAMYGPEMVLTAPSFKHQGCPMHMKIMKYRHFHYSILHTSPVVIFFQFVRQNIFWNHLCRFEIFLSKTSSLGFSLPSHCLNKSPRNPREKKC